MNKRQFKANEKHLAENGVYIENEPAWENYPYSRELYFRTPAGGDFSICVEEMNRESVIQAIQDFDINENTLLWWNSDRTPFETIKELYEDIEQWRDNLMGIANEIPY